MILFKRVFEKALLQGSKVTTLRAWKYPRVQAGKIYRTNLGLSLRVLRVDTVALTDLTTEMARADGFDTVKELRRALHECYATLPSHLYLVRFTVVP